MTTTHPTAAEDDDVAARLRVAVGRTARRLRRDEPGDLTPSQLSVLWAVDLHGPLRLGALAEHEGVSPPTLSRLVARLAELGLLDRSADRTDARSAQVHVTAAGRGLLADIRRSRTAALGRSLGLLTQEQRGSLAAALPALEALAEHLRSPASPVLTGSHR